MMAGERAGARAGDGKGQGVEGDRARGKGWLLIE